MNVSLYQAAAAMNASARWQDVIAENLGSSSSPGARRREVSFSAIAAGLNPATNTPSVIPRPNVGIVFQQGQIRPSGAPLDFAIEGKGFFEVQMANGDHGYTRDGEFHLNAQGQLSTKQGYLVLGDSGPITVDPSNTAPLSVSNTGDISQGDEVKGKLSIVEFNKPQNLTMAGQGYFIAAETDERVDNPTSSVHQGYVEAANGSPTNEMATLITAMRMFESNQRVLQMQDERSARAISELTGS